MKATADQTTAIQTQGRPLLVNAGAGTGKTWVLVERYLYLLTQHPDWPLESILAITFTKKAAREMRTRIRAAIENRVRCNPADSHWQERRRMVERIQVSTIHGLCARILKENAIAAGIDPLFDELDEQDTDLLKEEAIQQTLIELGDEDNPILDLLTAMRVRDLKIEMGNLLAKRGTVERIFAQLPEPEDLLDQWKIDFEAMKAQMWATELSNNPEFSHTLQEIVDIDIIDMEDRLSPSVLQAQEGCRLQANGDETGAVSLWLSIELRGGRAANWSGNQALTELKAMLKTLRETARKLEKAGFTQEIGADDEAAIQLLVLWKELWWRLNQRYDQLKAQQRALDFDDLEILAERLLTHQPKGERLSAYLEGINHVMVDEFQDTNEIQQSIVYALAHPRAGGRLFVVGDAKQSIYRFRQAQVSVFNRTEAQIRRASGFPPVHLVHSFRTQPALLSATNDFFDHLLQPQDGSYAEFEARPGALTPHRDNVPFQTTVPAPLEMILIPKQDSLGAKIDMEKARMWEAQQIAERLLSLHSSKFQVWDKAQQNYRAFRFSDAAVLMRATTQFPLYEEQFKSAGLPYLTVSGRGYYDRPEVQDLISLLQCLYRPGDDLSLAAALRSPLFSLSDETLYRLRWRTPQNEFGSEPVSLQVALKSPPVTDQGEEIDFAAGVLAALWSMAGRTPVWELLRTAINKTGYEATLALSDLQAGGMGRQRTNVLKLVEFAQGWGGASLSEFLKRVQALKAQEAREGEALGMSPESGAVQLMSIHAAKGLEFPVVVLADLGRKKLQRSYETRLLHDPAFGIVCQLRDGQGDWQKPASYRRAEWLDQRMEQAEDKRLMYVGCTRAADLLVLSGRTDEKQSWIYEILETFDLQEEGEAEEIVERDRYSIRIVRPTDIFLESERQVELKATEAGITQVPKLAQPLEEKEFPRAISVTQYWRVLATGGGDARQIRPVVIQPVGMTEAGFASAQSVGRIVHKALADWQCLSKPSPVLRAKLEGLARREGLYKPGVLHQAVDRSLRMLNNLRRQPIFKEIDGATERYTELPFWLHSPPGVIDGVIDLLYRDQGGNWNLVDWKTERVNGERVEELRREYSSQLAWYARAVTDIIGSVHQVSLVFLNPQVRVVRV